MFRHEVATAIAPLKEAARARHVAMTGKARNRAARLLEQVGKALFGPTPLAGQSHNATTEAGKVLSAELGRAVSVAAYLAETRIATGRSFLTRHPEAPLWMVFEETGVSPEKGLNLSGCSPAPSPSTWTP